MDSSKVLNEDKTELNKKIKSKNLFENLKSKHILKVIFNYLYKKITLDIIKYNKYIKHGINVDIDDYKKFCGTYSTIEIEITPAKNKYGKFINIDETNELFYHIYFNDGKEEIKRNYMNKNEQIKKIKIIINYQVKSFKKLFDHCECIENIYFKKFYRNIANMEYMFYGCSSLKELNVSNFNINNETKMNGMFYGCSSLTNINLSNFNTSNVTDMNDMFFGCASLKELNLSNFNTNKVTDMSGMFIGCSSLKELDLSNFNTNNVNNMYCMFFGCSSLIELNLSNFNTDNVTNISGMFTGCSDQLQKKIRTQYKNIKEGAFH